jgi:phosphatidylinositol-3-phosphatase
MFPCCKETGTLTRWFFTLESHFGYRPARDWTAVAVSNGDEGHGGVGGSGCSGCGTRLAPDQRYCLKCGERRGPLPAAVASWLSIVPPGPAGASPTTGGAAEAAGGATVADEALDEEPLSRYMPEPRTAAVAVMALLAFGVLLGGVTGPVAQSAGIAPIILYTGEEPAPISPEPEEEAAETVEPAPPASVPLAEEPLPAAPPPEAAPAPAPAPQVPLELPEEESLPPISHVFLIVLGDNGYEDAYGESSSAPYLAKTLREKGELLSNYYAVTQGDLANEIALISGQGPTQATAANCPEYVDVAPGTLDAKGLIQGDGCVYSAETQTLPAQLLTAKRTWKAYVEDIGNGQTGQATSCRHPALGGPDDAALPSPSDAYETWRNPFVYFHSLIDVPECGERDVGLDQLALDLKKETLTPSFSYIAPNACHAGDREPCEPGQPGGLAAAQPFLETVVPEIEASDAYKKGGLIAITFAQAPQGGPEPDTSACCSTPEYPNLPPAASPPAATNTPVKETGGGGRVGMLLLSPFVEPGSSNESGYYNHFSFLLSVGELLGVTPPLGYAAEPALAAFDNTVFNATESASPMPSRPPARPARSR